MLERGGVDGRNALWRCLCSCGTECLRRGNDLRTGKTSSCGCTMGHFTHGLARTRTHRIWTNMLDRCRTTGARGKAWAGRGITVCERWHSFENFLADMGEVPPGKSIDREDNNGNYEPGNCRWANATQQARNRRSNRIVEIRSERMSVAEAAERYGVDPKLLYRRLARGQSAETILKEAGRLVD